MKKSILFLVLGLMASFASMNAELKVPGIVNERAQKALKRAAAIVAHEYSEVKQVAEDAIKNKEGAFGRLKARLQRAGRRGRSRILAGAIGESTVKGSEGQKTRELIQQMVEDLTPVQ